MQVSSPQSTETAVPNRHTGTVPVSELPTRDKVSRETKLTMVGGMAPIKLAPVRFINVRAVKRPISVGIVTPFLVVPAKTFTTLGQTDISLLMKSHAICKAAASEVDATGGALPVEDEGATGAAMVVLRVGAMVGAFVGVAVMGVLSTMER